MTMQGFDDFDESIAPELKTVLRLLSVPLPDEPSALIQSLTKAEGWYARTGYLLAEAQSWLDLGKRFFLPERGQGTELDRKTELDANLADIRRIRDEVEACHDSIKVRIGLGQSLLAYKRQSIENEKVLRTSPNPY